VTFEGTFLLRRNGKQQLRFSVRLDPQMAKSLDMGTVNFLHVEINVDEDGRYKVGDHRARDIEELRAKLEECFFLRTPL